MNLHRTWQNSILCAGLTAAIFNSWAQSPSPSQTIEKQRQQESAAMPSMTPAQAAQYRAEYQAAKAKWASLTPQEQAAAIASARQKKIMDLTAIERVGQNNDMQRETLAQSDALRAQAEAAKASWAKLTPAEKQAVTQAAWKKKRSELNAIERVGQNDDTYILPSEKIE
jgi:hypothetical protein